jgi:ketosteroid isomerase-like protein
VEALFAQLRAGVAAEVTDAVETLTGRPPRSLAAFNKGVVRRVFEEVIPAGDRDGMRALMAPDFLDHDPLPGQPSGAEAGPYVVDTMHGAHPDLRFAIDDLVAEGDRVTIRWTLRGTQTGPLLGRPPSGRPVELKAIVIFRLAAGRLAERWAGWKPGFAPF